MKITDEQQRIISGWLRSGIPRGVLEARVRGAWNLETEPARDLIALVQGEMRDALARVNKPEFLAQQMERLEELAVRAQDAGQLGVALGCYRELHALAGLGR